MILECAECHTCYLVPDSAIGVEGRTVRCASCKHSWFQEPAPLDLVSHTDAMPPVEPATAIPAEPPPPSPFSDDGAAPPAAERYDAFPHQPPFKPRRNPARRWTLAAVSAGVLMLACTGAILYSGAPGIVAQWGLGIGTTETPLRFADKAIDRRNLPSGAELFAVSGSVVNPTDDRQRVPDIRAELRDAQGRLVYSWTIAPQRRMLPPRGTLDFNSGKLDVPSNSKMLELSFSGEGAS